jgi:hypothetical protein
MSFLNCPFALAEISRGGKNSNSKNSAKVLFLLNDRPRIIYY